MKKIKKSDNYAEFNVGHIGEIIKYLLLNDITKNCNAWKDWKKANFWKFNTWQIWREDNGKLSLTKKMKLSFLQLSDL